MISRIFIFHIRQSIFFFFYNRKLYSDIKNSISWYQNFFGYQKLEFFILKINFIFWHQEFDFLVSENHFLISQIRITDIRKWFSDFKNYFKISRIGIIDVNNYFFISENTSKLLKIAPHRKWAFDIKISIFWYHKLFYWYQILEFLIFCLDIFSDIRISFYIHVSEFWYFHDRETFRYQKIISDI